MYPENLHICVGTELKIFTPEQKVDACFSIAENAFPYDDLAQRRLHF